LRTGHFINCPVSEIAGAGIMKYKYEAIIVILATMTSIIVYAIDLSITDDIFFTKSHIDQMVKMLNEGSISGFNSGHLNIKIHPNVEWTWPSTIFYMSILSIFWYLYGVIIRSKKVPKKWIVCFSPPILAALAFGDLLFLPVYLLSCFLGARSLRES
jgi:hypothetical protein